MDQNKNPAVKQSKRKPFPFYTAIFFSVLCLAGISLTGFVKDPYYLPLIIIVSVLCLATTAVFFFVSIKESTCEPWLNIFSIVMVLSIITISAVGGTDYVKNSNKSAYYQEMTLRKSGFEITNLSYHLVEIGFTFTVYNNTGAEIDLDKASLDFSYKGKADKQWTSAGHEEWSIDQKCPARKSSGEISGVLSIREPAAAYRAYELAQKPNELQISVNITCSNPEKEYVLRQTGYTINDYLLKKYYQGK